VAESDIYLARVDADEQITATRIRAAWRLIDRRYADDPQARTELAQMLGFVPTQRAKKTGGAR